jgi:hypothetical protein
MCVIDHQIFCYFLLKSKPVEKQGRKVTGLTSLVLYDSGIAGIRIL